MFDDQWHGNQWWVLGGLVIVNYQQQCDYDGLLIIDNNVTEIDN